MRETGQTLNFRLRRQTLGRNSDGWTIWEEQIDEVNLPAEQAAIIICDMWDSHWSRGAVERVEQMVPRMAQVSQAARAKGIHIIHAPSGTLDFYAGNPARQRMVAVPMVPLPADVAHNDPPLPIDDSDGGSDTGETETYHAWSRQHAAIHIDEARDVISDDGHEIYSYLAQQAIQKVFIMGVHTNMCVLHRTFGIKQMIRWGINMALVRDLTDTIYNPAMAPYVSHDEGTQLVVGYIEKFWCPSVSSEDLA